MTTRGEAHEIRSDRWPVTAAELMTANPKSVSQHATIGVTAEVLKDRSLHVAPVIDDAGRPIGVVSRTDLLDYWIGMCGQSNLLTARDIDFAPDGAEVSGDDLRVREIMTPCVFSVRMDAPILSAARALLSRDVRTLFVIDGSGVLVGTIEINDILRALIERHPLHLRNTASHGGDPSNKRSRSCSLSSAVPS